MGITNPFKPDDSFERELERKRAARLRQAFADVRRQRRQLAREEAEQRRREASAQRDIERSLNSGTTIKR